MAACPTASSTKSRSSRTPTRPSTRCPVAHVAQRCRPVPDRPGHRLSCRSFNLTDPNCFQPGCPFQGGAAKGSSRKGKFPTSSPSTTSTPPGTRTLQSSTWSGAAPAGSATTTMIRVPAEDRVRQRPRPARSVDLGRRRRLVLGRQQGLLLQVAQGLWCPNLNPRTGQSYAASSTRASAHGSAPGSPPRSSPRRPRPARARPWPDQT